MEYQVTQAVGMPLYCVNRGHSSQEPTLSLINAHQHTQTL